MGNTKKTTMGGSRDVFLTTQWSLIEGIQAGKDQDQACVGFLMEQYWKPVYCFLRRRGHDNEEAKDLTQAFFHEVVLNRHLVDRADRARGRFRSFLLHALKQFVSKKDKQARAQKRIPREKLISLDQVDANALPESLSQASPEDTYHYTWVSSVLERALGEVGEACEQEGLSVHWTLFQERVIGPILHDRPAKSLSELCEMHGIADTKTASNMVVTVKRRYRNALMAQARRTVLSESQAPEELAELLNFLPKGAQPG